MMTLSLRIPLTEEQAAQLSGQVLLIVPLTVAELDLVGKATVAQADFIEANRAEVAAYLLSLEADETADYPTALKRRHVATVQRMRLLLEATENLTAASLLIRDILRRRLVIAPGTDGFGAVQWGRA
jgi:hypothetical protein